MAIIYFIIIFFLTAIIIAGIIQFFNILFRGYAPFIKTRKKIIKAIASEIKLNKKDIVYELGSGNASILRYLEKKYPVNKLIGIEYSFIPWIISKIQISLSNSDIIIKKQNFFKTDLSQADYVYCFLNIETMDKLEKKFLKECKKDCIIISYVFQLPHIKANKIIEINKNHIYLYKIHY